MNRCIAFRSDRRCPHRCSKRMGTLMICSRHTMWTALLTDQIRLSTRAVLAATRWETAAEGQVIIDQINRAFLKVAS
jgi:hypothetical protein